MTYYINIDKSNANKLLEAIQPLRDSGLVNYIGASEADISFSDTSLSDEELLAIVEEGEKDFENGNFYTMEEVDKMIESWKSK